LAADFLAAPLVLLMALFVELVHSLVSSRQLLCRERSLGRENPTTQPNGNNRGWNLREDVPCVGHCSTLCQEAAPPGKALRCMIAHNSRTTRTEESLPQPTRTAPTPLRARGGLPTRRPRVRHRLRRPWRHRTPRNGLPAAS